MTMSRGAVRAVVLAGLAVPAVPGVAEAQEENPLPTEVRSGWSAISSSGGRC